MIGPPLDAAIARDWLRALLAFLPIATRSARVKRMEAVASIGGWPGQQLWSGHAR